MELVNFNHNAQKNIDQLYPTGAFLTAGVIDDANTMTIGWGTIGIAWSKKTMVVMVTHSRFTHQLIEKYKEFTVTFPYEDMKEELMIVGTKSGRDHDKYELAKLSLDQGQAISTPHIDCHGMTLECKVIFKNEVSKEYLDSAIYDKRYAKSQDFHTVYYGEIITSYIHDKN
ncbi:MAG: flavin reductase family protein [Erysipelotrichaceae bacterium]|nr:flavin reductase family protein [Erysipelotrichaceae bacterium]MDD3923630.1 flavin reductase family protein [Erysipelotrichaceae bacterium]